MNANDPTHRGRASTSLRILRAIAKACLYVIAGAIAMFIIGQAIAVRSMPKLELWHTVSLPDEFDAHSPDTSMQAYFAREDRLQEELVRKVYAEVKKAGPSRLNRFHPDSLVNPSQFDSTWNRSREVEPADARGAVLLLHGLSDSPYSVRALAEYFEAKQFYVLVLRLPGHGTTPGSLRDVTWQDWAAAVELAARHAGRKIDPAKPFFIAGYSTGATLAVRYALEALEEGDLPAPRGLFLFSPAIGVSKLAFLAKWQLLLGKLPGFEKLAWLDLYPEFDPFKYNSFPTNAGEQIYLLTQDLSRRMQTAKKRGLLSRLPPIVAYASVVDATVPIEATVTQLFGLLDSKNNEFVLFDLNRSSETQQFINSKYDVALDAFLAREDLAYAITLVANREVQTNEVVARRKPPFSSSWSVEETGLTWPQGIYSLSHIAIPFRPDDPLYGNRHDRRLSLGTIEPRGERGVLTAPLTLFMRLRANPFYSYMQRNLDRVVDSLTNTPTPQRAD